MYCIICKNWLEEADGGTYFRSFGNYGSTVFDPMDGSYIDILICNPCLTRDARLAMCGREFKPVMCEGIRVGKARTPDRKEIVFDPAVMGSYDPDDNLHVDRDELGTDLPTVEWDKTALEYFRLKD